MKTPGLKRRPALPRADTPAGPLPTRGGYDPLAFQDARDELERRQQTGGEPQGDSLRTRLDHLVGEFVAAARGLGPCGVDAVRVLEGVERRQPNVPMPENLPAALYDGVFVGADAAAYVADSDLSKLRGVMPCHGEPRGRLLYVNGMGKTVTSTADNMQHVANQLQMEVVAVHSASQSLGGDLINAACDCLQFGANPAVDTLSEALYQQLQSGDPRIHLLAHSRGGLIAARALCALKNRLVLEDGHSRASAEDLMSRLKVQVAGVPPMSFPSGPEYKHFVNVEDVFATGWHRGRPQPAEHPATGCEVIAFGQPGDGSLRSRHGLVAGYLEQVRLHFTA